MRCQNSLISANSRDRGAELGSALDMDPGKIR
jgi:hypothetical protein